MTVPDPGSCSKFFKTEIGHFSTSLALAFLLSVDSAPQVHPASYYYVLLRDKHQDLQG